ncbi:MAG: sel1 repeat family protein [Firmicutes bacterium]|nr:sel1 repeat family protein [Bacillota bacterium]
MNDQKKIDEMYTRQAQLEAAYQAEMQSIIEADITPVIEEDIEFDEVIDMTKQRERETEELENSRKKAQEISDELIAAQKHTDITEINNDIVDMVEKSDLAEMFPNEVMDYSKGTDTMLMLFDLADREKNAEAQNILGVCYFSGTNVMMDLQKSMEYFHDAAEQGHSGAMRNLAIVMESAPNPDKNEIISLYEKAADKNDAYAINNLAVMYLTGDGVKKDPKRAAKLFERAAKLGDDYAMVNLAYCYSIGNGIKYSEKEAFKLYEKAAEKGNIEGLRNAAECLLAGKGTKQNLEAALSYFSKAAQLGDIKSQERVEELSGKLSGIKHDEVVAGAPEKKKSLSEVLQMGKQAAENSKNPDVPEKTMPKTKGDR